MADRHGPRETQIFRRFARAAGLVFRDGSVAKRSPPEPDILCLSEGGEPLAFELVELIDQDYALRAWSQLKLKSQFETAYDALEPDRKARVAEQIGNALVHVVFDEGATFRAKEDAVDQVFEAMAGLDAAFEGKLRRPVHAGLPAAVDSIRVSRLDSLGPFFDVDAVGSLGDPTIETIRGKWAKTYQTIHPIELLAYYELQPEPPEAFWRQQLAAFLDANASSSPFRRVWVYDCGAEAVRFSSEYLGSTQRGA